MSKSSFGTSKEDARKSFDQEEVEAALLAATDLRAGGPISEGFALDSAVADGPSAPRGLPPVGFA
jgi:hypothetical protein